ncbi:inactive peptidyl-prolyl cis-trans isomerase shutdown-like isoform X1 [Maniola jurtina]|uniref:inactive peptidyl-prolyl cis-trans isomerase shutdown-like isoform X1 n=1 Tax=Maniola jurtina TaxID=191418 RepID=UPI001E68C230|nr:inactive peptidyl-prolyl cis-trans isomerase shutdown-like isoform X1 [Maniola jurtina]
MDELFKDSVQLSKGINIKELISRPTEFHIDLDFKKKSMGMMMGCDDDLLPDMDEDEDSDTEDAFKIIERTAEKMMLSCPEYHSFKDLASKMVDCIPSGEVKMLVIEEGDGPLVPVDAMVTIHHAAYFENAKIPFDSTLTTNNQAPLRMRLGCKKFIPGLEIGLTMVKGPKARFLLLVEPSMAWGPQGVFPRIRPEPALFVIVLYQVEDTQAAARFNDLPSEEQKKFEVTMNTVTSLHSHAKHLFSKGKYAAAVKDYQQSISILNISQTEDEREQREIKKLKVNSCVNLCVCYYKLNKPKYILDICNNLDYIIDIETHCKALFYYGRAYEMLGKQDEAVKYYKKALKLEPKNKDIGNALANIDKYNLKSAEKEKELWQNAFKSLPEEKKVVYDVDEDFQDGVLEMCQGLAGRDEYSKFDLPNGLSKGEVDCIKDLCSKFEGLAVLEDGEGRRKRISIVRKLLG